MARPIAMMRMRNLKPDFFDNDGLAELDDNSRLPCRLAYLGLCCCADEYGRFEWKPKKLGGHIFKYQPEHQAKMPEIMELLAGEPPERNYIVKYQVDGLQFGYFPHWDDHYIRRDKDSQAIWPTPPISGSSGPGIAINPALPGDTVTGSGSGIGNGSGRETVTATDTDTAASQTVAPPHQLHTEQIKTKTSKFKHTGSSALSLLAMSQHISCVTGMPEIRVNDPVLPLLVSYVDEQLATIESWPCSVPPSDWSWDLEHTDEDYGSWIEVKPGDPRYPDSDTPLVDGGFSRRESACNYVWCRFGFAIEILMGLSQYLPEEIKTKGEDLPEGTLDVSDEAIDVVMRKLLGFPNGPLSYFEHSLAEFWAVTHWAFNKSDYWPARLKTVDDVIRKFPELVKQYEKYYAKLPEGKKPHDLGVGRPSPQDCAFGEEGGQQ
jgi:hypothetical protein